METMQAILADRIDGELDVQLAEVPVPRPGLREVLIESRAIDCRPSDVSAVRGARPPTWRGRCPGEALAGVVREVGEAVRRVRPGQRVLAFVDGGAYATHAVATEERVFPLPSTLDFEAGAAIGTAYRTAYCALVHRAVLRPGEWLLVHGAVSSVGAAAVQLGKALEARVIATAGSETALEVARRAGADVALPEAGDAWVERVRAETKGEGADVVFDPVGGELFDLSTKCIAFQGRVLVVEFAGGRVPSVAVNRVLLKNFSVVGVNPGVYHRERWPLVEAWMRALFTLYEQGRLRPLASPRFPLREAAAALRAVAGRDGHGAAVLVP